MQQLTLFLKDEDGAVTIEWVALAAGVVILAIGVITVLSNPITGVAGNIGSSLQATTSSTMAEALTVGG